MKSKKKTKQVHKQNEAGSSGRNRRWLLAAVLVGAIAGIIYWGTKNSGDVDHTHSTPAAATPPAPAQKELLVGRWARTDSNGGYTLEIRGASDNGKLDASYFNPNPINVGSAAWHNSEGSLSIVVELRDVNYPGSTYTLSFSKTNDQLVGTYYQAVESVNYDVTFARLP